MDGFAEREERIGVFVHVRDEVGNDVFFDEIKLER